MYVTPLRMDKLIPLASLPWLVLLLINKSLCLNAPIHDIMTITQKRCIVQEQRSHQIKIISVIDNISNVVHAENVIRDFYYYKDKNQSGKQNRWDYANTMTHDYDVKLIRRWV